jgi:hypothetical protein
MGLEEIVKALVLLSVFGLLGSIPITRAAGNAADIERFYQSQNIPVFRILLGDPSKTAGFAGYSYSQPGGALPHFDLTQLVPNPHVPVKPARYVLKIEFDPQKKFSEFVLQTWEAHPHIPKYSKRDEDAVRRSFHLVRLQNIEPKSLSGPFFVLIDVVTASNSVSQKTETRLKMVTLSPGIVAGTHRDISAEGAWLKGSVESAQRIVPAGKGQFIDSVYLISQCSQLLH